MNDTTRLFLIGVTAAIIGALALAIWMIGADRLFTLALIFVGGVVLAGLVAASALPIRAARKKDPTGETRILDGTRTIVKETKVLDGRAPADVKLLQLPPQPQGGAWPELLRASWQAGLLANPKQPKAQDPQDFDFTGDNDGWGGDIAP